MSIEIASNTDHIIWDLDGTILDSFPIHVEIMGKVLQLHGRPVPSDLELAHHFHGSLEQSMRGLAGDVSDKELEFMLKDFLEIDNAYVKDVDEHLHPDAIDLATKAHAAGIHQVIVTNRAHGTDRGTASPRTMIQRSVLRACIDQIICGDEVETRKPHPNVLDGLDNKIDLSRTLVVGDQYIDGEFAYNLGARALLVNRSSDPIAHIHKLTDEMHERLIIVKSLSEVRFKNVGLSPHF